jgi:hypothetical protein
MNELRRGALGFDRIAGQLTTDGLLNRVGKPWGGQAANRILTRPGIDSRRQSSR